MVKCARCGRIGHVMDRCFAKTHFDGTGISFNATVKSFFEKRVKAEKSRRLVVKAALDHTRATQDYVPYMIPPPGPGYKGKKRVWYYRHHKYMKRKDGTWVVSGENPYWHGFN